MMKKVISQFFLLFGIILFVPTFSSYHLSSTQLQYVARISDVAEKIQEKKPHIYPKIIKILKEYRDKKSSNVTIASIIDLSIKRISQETFGYKNSPKIAYVVDPEFDVYLNDTTHASFFLGNYWRMYTFSPFFDAHTQTYPYAWFYKDLYAIYVDEDSTNTPESWFLRDSQGEKLYINWGCETTCPQYAANIFEPTFRAYWIEQARNDIKQGYKGIWIDDVNMDWRISNEFGENRLPVNPQTGETISLDEWREAMVVFLQEIRQAFPDNEIVHNSLWSAQTGENSWIEQQIETSDFINIEHGILDEGLTGYEGLYSLGNFFTFIDTVHSLGKSVLLGGEPATNNEREYYLAGWYLTQALKDALIVQDVMLTPGNTPWEGYSIDIGKPLSNRYIWNNVWRRDFENGSVLLNPPDRDTVEIQIQGYDIYGTKFQTIRIPAKSGKIIVKDA